MNIVLKVVLYVIAIACIVGLGGTALVRMIKQIIKFNKKNNK